MISQRGDNWKEGVDNIEEGGGEWSGSAILIMTCVYTSL